MDFWCVDFPMPRLLGVDLPRPQLLMMCISQLGGRGSEQDYLRVRVLLKGRYVPVRNRSQRWEFLGIFHLKIGKGTNLKGLGT